MKRYTILGIASLLAVMPAASQEIIQRMERDVLAAGKVKQQIPKAPLLGLSEVQSIALFRRFAPELRSEESGMLRRVALRLRQGDYVHAQEDWELALGKMTEREIVPDLDELVVGVLRHAYVERDGEFKTLADAIRFRQQQRQAAYEERASLERLQTAFEEGRVSDDLRVRRLTLADNYETGVRPVERAAAETPTAESVATDLQRIVVLCNTADANAQQAVVDLQMALEGEPLQSMSNASKMLHDAAKAVISNMKA